MVNVLAKNHALEIGLVPPFFKSGYTTVPGVYCNNYAVVNVVMHACNLVSFQPFLLACIDIDRVTDVNGHETSAS